METQRVGTPDVLPSGAMWLGNVQPSSQRVRRLMRMAGPPVVNPTVALVRELTDVRSGVKQPGRRFGPAPQAHPPVLVLPMQSERRLSVYLGLQPAGSLTRRQVAQVRRMHGRGVWAGREVPAEELTGGLRDVVVG